MRKWFTRCAAAAVLILVVLLAMALQFRGPAIRTGKPLPPGKCEPRLANATDTAVLLAPDGSLWAWGEYSAWRTPFQGPAISQVPRRVGSDSDWAQVAAGLKHMVALKADGSLWAWGLNSEGQAGQSDVSTNYDTPTEIGRETNWTKVSASYFHNLALKNDHSLWAWGLNLRGQLGDGTTSNRSAPVRIGMDRDWQTIAAGGHSSYALKINGTLWGWGADFSTTTWAPRQIAPGTNWLAISPDDANLLIALKTDGTLWLRGRRFNLLATQVDSGGVDLLTQVGLDNDWSEIYAGRDSFFARKKRGGWWVCGLNTEGQLGAGGIGAWAPSPKALRFNFEPWAFAPGEGTTVLLNRDGKLWTWGRRWGVQRSGVSLSPWLRRFPLLNSLFQSGVDKTPRLLWELPPEARGSSGTQPKKASSESVQM